ncbi:MAG: ABC transporter substrate-binding protein [Cyanobacteria bacterium RU_5_0]|nr:ABC transporter substrate-binding protein [Cyanobacteria bacterium RU_5_0]
MIKRNGNRNSTVALYWVIALIGILITACQDIIQELPISRPAPESGSPEPKQGLKLGALLPYTGDLALLGQPVIQTLPIVVDRVNACGGVNDANVELIVEDDQTRSDAATVAMSRLVEEDVGAVIVGFSRVTSTPVLNIAIDSQIPVISPSNTSPSFTEQAKQGIFKGFWMRTVSSDVYQARALAKFAIEQNIRTISIVVVDNEDGISFENAFIEAFESLGGIILTKTDPIRYNPQSPSLDFEASVAFLPYTGKPDAVVADLDPQGGIKILRSAYELGLTNGVQILLTDGVQPDSFSTAVGLTYDGIPILEGAIGIVPGATGPGLEALANLWQEQEEGSLPPFVAQTWDAASLILLAAQAANVNDGNAIQEKLRNVANPPGIAVIDVCEGLKMLKSGQDIDYQGASGNVDIDENGDVIGSYEFWTVDEQGNVERIN